MDKKASWRRQEAEKVPTETFLDDFWAPSRNQEGPKIDPTLVQNEKNTSATIAQIVLFSLLASLAGATGQLSRFGVGLILILGRFGVDLGVDVGLSWVEFKSVCLSVCLCLPSRDHYQTARPGGMREAIQ